MGCERLARIMNNLCIYFVKGVLRLSAVCRHSVDGLNRVRNFSLGFLFFEGC